MAPSSSRPHRQARSGVCYRDSFYDYDDDDDLSFCRRRQPSTTTTITTKKCKDSQNAAKKNLTSTPTWRYKDRANAKERAEAVQLQRAINESLLKSSPEAAAHLDRAINESLPASYAGAITSAFNDEKDMVDCEDADVTNSFSNHEKVITDCTDDTTCNNYTAFHCLLDVATEAVLEGNINLPKAQGTMDGLLRKQIEESQVLELQVEIPNNGTLHEEPDYELNIEHDKCEEYSPEKVKDQIHKVDKVDSDSSNEWVEDNSEQADTEDESSDLSDESVCVRKRPVKVQLKGRQGAVKDNRFPVQVKKVRSGRPLLKLKAEALSTANCQTSISSPDKPSVQQIKAPGGKENFSTSPSTRSIQSLSNMVSNLKHRIAAENVPPMKTCQSVGVFHGPCLVNKSQVFDSVSPEQQGILSLLAPSPTLVHRRVIGLSRRSRPPPLHPYLSKRDR